MSEIQMPQFSIHDFILKGPQNTANPFQIEVSATFVHEGGTEIANIPAFYNGGDEWVIRFSPTLPGRWTGRTTSEADPPDGVDLGSIECIANDNPAVHGRLQTDPNHPQRFAWEDGTPFIMLGFECDWLFAYHQESPGLCEKHVELIREHGFNDIVMNIYAHRGFSDVNSRFEGEVIEGMLYAPPRMYVFDGTNEEPDHSHLNVEFFKDYDAMMRLLHARGIVAHLMIQVQNKHVNWPARPSPEDDLYWRYVVARYQAFGNVIWDIGKESYNLLRSTGSHAYTLGRMQLIRDTDAYGHLITVHDSEAGSTGRISEADGAADFCSDQIHLSDVDRYYREARRKLRIDLRPYVNIEYGYEMGAENLKTYRSRTTVPWQDILKWTWALYMAGAYPGYYYSNTSWDLIRFEPEPEGWPRYRYLMDVLESINFNAMEPIPELVDRGYCLANDGEEYLISLSDGGNVSLDLTALPYELGERGQLEQPLASATATWMDIFTGERREVSVTPAGWSTRLENPLSDPEEPCVVVVRTKSSRA